MALKYAKSSELIGPFKKNYDTIDGLFNAAIEHAKTGENAACRDDDRISAEAICGVSIDIE